MQAVDIRLHEKRGAQLTRQCKCITVRQLDHCKE